jgi:pyruvate/2-oxoglutarate dehydrogenase complex dihydrolipoamide acyltransferase (E2) component
VILLNAQLGFMSAFLKASANALKEIPAVNGYIDDRTKEIVHRNYVDISVAVASPQGKHCTYILSQVRRVLAQSSCALASINSAA